MYKKTLIITIFFISSFLYGGEPISPIPIESGVNIEKSKLGKELFFDPILSKDYSTSCLSCHDVYLGGGDEKPLSIGFDNTKGNIHSPTVFNARYNFAQFWNGRAKDLYEQADGPLTNPAEHNMNAELIEERLNNSDKYRKKFNAVYDTSHITYKLVIDAIVEFEMALTTPNSKFDKFLRDETELSSDEKEGYAIFKDYGCITCHNGVNIGGNSFQKMGTFIEYNSDVDYPDRAQLKDNKNYKNVFKVPTLRNITLSAPYFHDGSAKDLKDAIYIMSKHNLGISLDDEKIDKIIIFLHTLKGEKPKILDL